MKLHHFPPLKTQLKLHIGISLFVYLISFLGYFPTSFLVQLLIIIYGGKKMNELIFFLPFLAKPSFSSSKAKQMTWLKVFSLKT
jgi:uncharacterized membrane protein